MTKQWCNVGEHGLGKQAGELGKGRLVSELIQNAIDENSVSKIVVFVEKIPGVPQATSPTLTRCSRRVRSETMRRGEGNSTSGRSVLCPLAMRPASRQQRARFALTTTGERTSLQRSGNADRSFGAA